MTGVRFRPDVGFEGRCELCREWWMIDAECWDHRHGLARCRACLKTLKNERSRSQYATDEVLRERKRLEARAQRLAKGRGYGHKKWREIAANPERLAAANERHRLGVQRYRDRQRDAAA